MKAFALRRADLDDAPALARILHEGWRRAFIRPNRKVDVAVFLAETEGETVILAERGKRILGFAAVYEPESFLHHLYVDPRFHRHGVGSALLNASRDLAREPLTLKTQTQNVRARAFYARHGFFATEEGDDGNGPWIRLQAPS